MYVPIVNCLSTQGAYMANIVSLLFSVYLVSWQLIHQCTSYFDWIIHFQEGEALLREKPECREQLEPLLENLNKQWDELETTSKSKGEKLFDANRAVLYKQSCDDIDGWITQLESQVITSEDFGKDLTTVNLHVQKQNVSENDQLF